LFVVEEGQLDCYKTLNSDEQPTYLKTYEPGEAFGELALLYNAPRAATIIAKTDALCWELDRNTFNSIVKVSSQKKRERYENFL
jgi:cAMP-dependent protein kinase regulator